MSRLLILQSKIIFPIKACSLITTDSKKACAVLQQYVHTNNKKPTSITASSKITPELHQISHLHFLQFKAK